MNIQERHLIDRYLQGELSGIELEDFKNRLTADETFKKEVDLLSVIYSGIHLAREEQLEKKILASVKYRKPTIPFALKLIIAFLVITSVFISLWFYAGKEFADNKQQKPWYSFLNKSIKTEKSKTLSKAKASETTKSGANNEIKNEASDTATTEQNPLAEPPATELNEAVDTTDLKNSADIVVKQDQLMITSTLPVTDKSSNEKQNADNSLTADASQKMPTADLPEAEVKAKNFEVEFWVSPINYKGYKMSKNKIILFGIEEPDAVKLYRVNDAVYMSYLKNYYELETNYDFKPFQKIKESDVPGFHQMKIQFSKYQGTGNDFILVDNRDKKYSNLTTSQIAFLCDRRFGIGADGLILLEQNPQSDFYMKYFNSDGNESSMCGNGGRCITAYAKSLNLINNQTKFFAIDGGHEAIVEQDSPMIVKLKMSDVSNTEMIGDDVYLNTGSPHYVRFVKDTLKTDIIGEARNIRYNDRFSKEGTNVNFVQPSENSLIVRSYERGVEDETLSCGTGVTASVLASVAKGIIKDSTGVCSVKVMGGSLKVYYEKSGTGFKNVWLEGEAKFVYTGTIEI